MSRDFLRQMPGADQYFSKGVNFFYRLHIDPILFFLLVLLSLLGLGILYSASGQNIEYVEQQAVRLSVAFGLMFFLAQLDPNVFKH